MSGELELKIPKLGLTMTEGTVTEWLVDPGQSFQAGDILVIIETDKIANEIEAPAAGTLSEVLVQPGETMDVGVAIARWRPAEQAVADPAPAPAAPAETPAADRRRPATRFEASLARRMAQAKAEVPHFYLVTQCDADPLLTALGRFKSVAELPRITVTHVLLHAVAQALLQQPESNCVWDDGEIVEFTRAEVGVAVNAPGGLVVPVVRDAGAISLAELARQTDELARRARDEALAADDVGGGALTVSNAGMYDVTAMYPIITPGQSAILGAGSIRSQFRPDESGRPVPRREITLVLSLDHRVHDGARGIALLNAIRTQIEAAGELDPHAATDAR